MTNSNKRSTRAQGGLPNIHELRSLSKEDEACLGEVRAVLEKHNCLNRFGVFLLHEHFETADDEILIEEADEETRTLRTTPQKKASLDEENSIVTHFQLGAKLKEIVAKVRCNVPHW